MLKGSSVARRRLPLRRQLPSCTCCHGLFPNWLGKSGTPCLPANLIGIGKCAKAGLIGAMQANPGITSIPYLCYPLALLIKYLSLLMRSRYSYGLVEQVVEVIVIS